jgi:N-methylhydantoinase A
MRTTRIGIDTGGTFTDVVALRGDGVFVGKVPSTPRDPSRAVCAAIACAAPRDVPDVVHGTTVGLNALLTGDVARVAFVTNEGFRDLIEIGRQARTDLYDLSAAKPTPPVPRELRFCVGGRRHADGTREPAPSAAELRSLGERIRRSGASAVAIGLLHSHSFPDDERRIARALATLGLPITCSAELAPIEGEFERFTAAIVNAAIAPGMGRYLGELSAAIAPGRVRLMRSSGGILPAAEATRFPARGVFSGPAGGVLAAHRLFESLGFPILATLDMGGTSTDVGLVGADVARFDDRSIAGLPLALPAVDLHTVGCGGGSIAYADAAGALRVGPASAGADPGPACYGKGDDATVTDAHVALGHIGAETLLGGGLPIDPDRSVRAVERLARQLALSPQACAEGIVEVAEVSMTRALLVMTVERAIEPSDVALLAFGGAGGLHAVELARRLQMAAAIVPPHPGAFSALGLALAADSAEVTVPVQAPLAHLRAADRTRIAKSAVAAAREALGAARGVTRTLTARLRFRGQGRPLEVAFGPSMADAFAALHAARFGFVPSADVELVEVRCRLETRAPALPDLVGETAALGDAKVERRRRAPLGGRTWTLVARDGLAVGSLLVGPLLIEEATGVVRVPAGATARITSSGIVVATGGAQTTVTP